MLSTFRPARAALSDYAKLQAEHAALKSHFHESEKLQSVLEQDRQRHYKLILSQLPPKPLDESARYLCRSLSVEDPKYAFLSRQFESSIVGHRLRLGSDLWCDPATRFSSSTLSPVLVKGFGFLGLGFSMGW